MAFVVAPLLLLLLLLVVLLLLLPFVPALAGDTSVAVMVLPAFAADVAVVSAVDFPPSAFAFVSITDEELDEEEELELMVAFVGLPPDSISIVVSGPVPREHWYSTREMMSATC